MNHVEVPRVEVPLDGLKLWTLLQSHAASGEPTKMSFEGNAYPGGSNIHQHDLHQINNCSVQHHQNGASLANDPASTCRCPLCPLGQNHSKGQSAAGNEHHRQHGSHYHSHQPPNLPSSKKHSTSSNFAGQTCRTCNKKIRRTKKQIQQQARSGISNSPVCDKCSRSESRNFQPSSGDQISFASYSGHSRVPQLNEGEYSSQYSMETADVSAHVCKLCRKGFAFKHDLDRHLKASKGECGKQFKCPKCSKYFSNGGNLKRHSMIHTGEKPYECHLCPKCFRSKTLLSNHIRTHTGERPYLCRYCEKRFSKSENLKRHEKIHIKNGTTAGLVSVHNR